MGVLNILLLQLKAASKAKREFVIVKNSRFVIEVLSLLYAEGRIVSFEETGDSNIKVYLKYFSKRPAIVDIQRISTSGRRIYLKVSQLDKLYRFGEFVLVSSSKGLFFHKQGNVGENLLGGEALFIIK